MATIVHFELPADDVDRAKGFWEGVFGWNFQGVEGPFEYLMTQGGRGTISCHQRTAVRGLFRHRGFSREEAAGPARFCAPGGCRG
jgi:predicted enzyme related to lactoylglutathione lyase